MESKAWIEPGDCHAKAELGLSRTSCEGGDLELGKTSSDEGHLGLNETSGDKGDMGLGKTSGDKETGDWMGPVGIGDTMN